MDVYSRYHHVYPKMRIPNHTNAKYYKQLFKHVQHPSEGTHYDAISWDLNDTCITSVDNQSYIRATGVMDKPWATL